MISVRFLLNPIKYNFYLKYHHSLRTEEDINYIEINCPTRVFLPVRVNLFFASLENLHKGIIL